MKIHYLSCHAILEYDEVKLLTDLGYEVYSNGVYRDPRGAYNLPRPGIPNMPFDQKFFDLTANHPKTDLPPELIEPYDTFIFMGGLHNQPLISNWDKIKHKRVILRTIGQSTTSDEASVKKMRAEGLQIIRYSPKEKNIPGYQGSDALIRFYKDPEEFEGWIGDDRRPVNFTQSLKGRRDACRYDEVMGSLVGFQGAKVYGSGNDDLGKFNGGEVPYEQMKLIMRHARAFIYTGSWPASYTLSPIEAMMTGMPIVTISKRIAYANSFEKFDYFEMDEIIQNKVNGFVCDSIGEMRQAVEQLIANDALAKEISINARKTAVELFDKQKIAKQWKEFLG
jgi:glycosyltransferase involved in cell wall biosynthesis